MRDMANENSNLLFVIFIFVKESNFSPHYRLYVVKCSIFASLEYSSLIYLLIRFFIHNFFLLFSILSISSSIYFVFVLSKTNKLTCLLSWTYWISHLVSQSYILVMSDKWFFVWNMVIVAKITYSLIQLQKL